MYLCAYTHAHTHTSHEGHIPSNHVERVSEKLLQAASKGQLNELKRLIEEVKVNPMEKDESGVTVIHCTAENGHLDILKYLIEERSLDLACRDEDGETPLHAAARNNHLELVKYLVGEQQVDPLCRNEHGYTPLHRACQGGDIEVIQYLISEMKKHISLKEVICDETKVGFKCS